MIVKEDFLKKLRSAFDLNEYEVKIWTALLSRGVSAAGELSEISNVPRSRSYDVLETLEKKGFIIMKLGKPIKYMAVKPEEILRRVKSQFTKRAEEQVKMLDEVKDTNLYRELQLLHDQGIKKIEPSDLSGALRGRNKVYDQLENMMRKAQKSITIMTTAKGLSRKSEILIPILKKLRNVKVRIAAPITKDNKDIADILKKYADIRSMDKVNARFCLVDGKELLFMMMDDDKVHESYDTGVWVDTSYFASALEQMFNLTWENLKE
jgi:sugar-specific transcriptional regulator TrmB